jgi:hypothetical protein
MKPGTFPPPLSLKAYVEAHPSEEWRAKQEDVVYLSPCARFRIIREMSNGLASVGRSIRRDEKLMDQGIHPNEADGKEFAQALIDTMFMETSPYEMAIVADALNAFVARWEAEVGRKVRDR